jgi:hypothetical protein
MSSPIYRSSSFIDKKISVKQARTVLAKNDIEVDDYEAAVILSFLYLAAKTYHKQNSNKHGCIHKRKSNCEKIL